LIGFRVLVHYFFKNKRIYTLFRRSVIIEVDFQKTRNFEMIFVLLSVAFFIATVRSTISHPYGPATIAIGSNKLERFSLNLQNIKSDLSISVYTIHESIETLFGVYQVTKNDDSLVLDVDSSIFNVTGYWSMKFSTQQMNKSTFFVVYDDEKPFLTAPGEQNFNLPPLGFNAWFAFDTHLNSSVMRSSGEGLIRTGLFALGFKYVNLDGGWQAKSRNPDGTIAADPTKFPEGIQALSDYLHKLGLWFGVYTDRGTNCCSGEPGSFNHEVQDVATYVGFDTDFVKSDACAASMVHTTAIDLYSIMQDAINSSNRQIFFSLCGWLKWYAKMPQGVGQSWRIGPDALSWDNVLMNFDAAADAAFLVGPAHFADVDEIMGPSRGRPISVAQTQTQASLIAIVASPMLLSFDLTNKSSDDPDVAPFANPELIAIHQDPAASGPYYRRLAGLYVSRDKRAVLTRVPCDASNPYQTWKFNVTNSSTNTGYFFTGATTCLHAGPAWFGTFNNAQVVWLASCGWLNPGMCDPAVPGCLNQQWTINTTDFTITSPYITPKEIPNSVPGNVMTLDDIVPNAIFLENEFADSDPNRARQLWTYNSNNGLLQSNFDQTCLQAYETDTTNVWGRRLVDGSWALLFMNIGPNAAIVTCDAGCFGRAGFQTNATFTVRDVWNRVDLPGIVSAANGASYNVTGNGASLLYRFFPQ
jgi:Alpha galactosidase A/Alpha galactosidase C-terminal beta sandwich domain